MKTDVNGRSICLRGKEQYEYFHYRNGKRYVQYDYRAFDGELFSIITPTLGEARRACNKWLNEKYEKYDKTAGK